MTQIDCHQLTPNVGDLKGNQAQALDAIRASAAAGADIILLPELTTSGYMFASAAEARELAITADDPMLSEWAAAAGDAMVIGGFAEQGSSGQLHNSAAIVDRTGVVAVYRKIHLWDNEKIVFTPGDAPPPILETRHGRIAVVVCYDLEFPELTREIALAGADLIAAPTNWPLMDRPAGEHSAEVGIAMATARVNHLAIACCDRGGIERGQAWTGGTHIIDDNGWIVATPDADGVARADLDLTLSRDKAMTPLVDAFGDRRPQLYAAISAVYEHRSSSRFTVPTVPRVQPVGASTG